MRLEDKARKRRRVRRLAQSALASSISQRKLGLRPEHVFPPHTRQRTRVLNPTPPPKKQQKNPTLSQYQKRNIMAAVLDQRSVGVFRVLLISPGHRTALMNNRGCTR